MAIQITEDVLAQISEHASRGLTKEQIASALGWARSTLFAKIKDNPDVSDAIKAGAALGLQQVANALYTNATEHNNTTAQIFYLKNRAPEEWKDRVPEGAGETPATPVKVEFTMVDGRKNADQSNTD